MGPRSFSNFLAHVWPTGTQWYFSFQAPSYHYIFHVLFSMHHHSSKECHISPCIVSSRDSLISKQFEISADFKKMNRGFMTCLIWLYFKIFCLFFSGFEFLKVSKSTFWNKRAHAWFFLRKRINTHFCLLES